MALDIAKNIETNCNNDAGRCCGDLNRESLESNSDWKTYIPITITVVIFLCGIVLDYFKTDFFKGNMRLLWYIVAYLPVALPSFKNAGTALAQKDFFNEFTLMIVATLGAFLIGEYPEAVAVMLFYTIGEMFQNSAVQKARKNIKSLLDVRPDSASVIRNGSISVVNPESVAIGEFVQVKAGEKIPLDGKMLTAKGSFNTSALTGESVPRTIREGEPVLAGMVNLNSVIDLRVEKKYEDSSLARVLEMVQEASSRKSKTELFIRRFARIYTPIVFALALAITIIPSFIVSDYLFSDWLYRALVFLVISCPCALVISIPLSYFGGIGEIGRNGILFKGANYLDMIAKANTVVIDKTGTLTEGIFEVQEVKSVYKGQPEAAHKGGGEVVYQGQETLNPEQMKSLDPEQVKSLDPEKEKMAGYVAALESKSNHPIAKAILEHSPNLVPGNYSVEEAKEIAGRGMKGLVNGHVVLAGNSKLM